MNENEDETYRNLWELSKVVLRGKFIAVDAYITKEGSVQISNLSHIKRLKKEVNQKQGERKNKHE